MRGSGLHLYRVLVGHRHYSFRGMVLRRVSGSASDAEQQVADEALHKAGNLRAAIDDVIAVAKDGYLLYRVVATSSDTSGVEIQLIASAGTVTDTDGNVYQTVRIGSQVWTAENLRATKYSNGEAIPLVPEDYAWSERGEPGYCYYDNTRDADTIKKYGALYNYHAVAAYEGKIAPPGWHVPSDAEWDTLQSYLIANGYNWDGTTNGNKIAKSLAAKTDWREWATPGGVGNEMWKNNRSGFSAPPAGERDGLDGFFPIIPAYVRATAAWWSTTGHDSSHSCSRFMSVFNTELTKNTYHKSTGCSVRLVKD